MYVKNVKLSIANWYHNNHGAMSTAHMKCTMNVWNIMQCIIIIAKHIILFATHFELVACMEIQRLPDFVSPYRSVWLVTRISTDSKGIGGILLYFCCILVIRKCLLSIHESLIQSINRQSLVCCISCINFDTVVVTILWFRLL
jgi:hypothetical protein